jgi:hypothetical protein
MKDLDIENLPLGAVTEILLATVEALMGGRITAKDANPVTRRCRKRLETIKTGK